MHTSFRATSASFTQMRASISRIRLECACIPSHGIRAPLPHDFDERLHQPWQIVGCRAGSQQAVALLDRQLDDRPVELRLGLAQESRLQHRSS